MESGGLKGFAKEQKYKTWSAFNISNQNLFMIVSESSDEISIYNTKSCELLKNIVVPNATGIWDINQGADKDEIVVALRNGGAIIINWVKEEIIQKVGKEMKSTKSAYYNPSKEKLILSSPNGKTVIYSSLTGDILKSIRSSEGAFDAKFSVDGTLYGVAMGNGELKLFNANTHKQTHTFQHNNSVNNFCFNKENSLIASASYDNSVKVWDLKTGKLLHTLKHDNRCYTAEFINNDNYIITTGADYSTILWDATTGKKLYTRLQLKNGDWLIYDEHYRYDGTPGARDLLYFVCGTEIIELNQVKDALYVPGLANIITSGNSEALESCPKLEDLDICDAFPVIESDENNETGYNYTITPRQLELKAVEVFVNDKRIMSFTAADIPLKKGVFELSIPAASVEKHFIQGQENSVELFGVVKDENSLLRSRGA